MRAFNERHTYLNMAMLLCGALLAGNVAFTSTARAAAFSYDGIIETYVVGTTGLYDVTAIGAAGGASIRGPGGKGASVEGLFNLTAGTVLEILVGQQGGDAAPDTANGPGGGGGGGSFVVTSAGTALAVGGGGGGAGYYTDLTEADASTTTSGVAGQYGGNGGRGGSGGTASAGSAGGGLTSAGGLSGAEEGAAGQSYTNGGAGGTAGISTDYALGGSGGFGGGGGGGAANAGGGGGGGGYSGGGGGYYSANGGGGGSYLDASAIDAIIAAGAAPGNGYVTIALATVPEPASLILLSGAVGLLGMVRRRRHRIATVA